jgi:hypothetical protein
MKTKNRGYFSIMNTVRKFFSVSVRLHFSSRFPREFRLDIVDGLIEKIILDNDDLRTLENLFVVSGPCSVYFKQGECLIMIDETRLVVCSGKRADRWLFETVSSSVTARSKCDNQVYKIFKTSCDVDPFIEKERVELDGFEDEFETLDDNEVDRLYLKMKKERENAKRGRGRGGLNRMSKGMSRGEFSKEREEGKSSLSSPQPRVFADEDDEDSDASSSKSGIEASDEVTELDETLEKMNTLVLNPIEKIRDDNSIVDEKEKGKEREKKGKNEEVAGERGKGKGRKIKEGVSGGKR